MGSGRWRLSRGEVEASVQGIRAIWGLGLGRAGNERLGRDGESKESEGDQGEVPLVDERKRRRGGQGG